MKTAALLMLAALALAAAPRDSLARGRDTLAAIYSLDYPRAIESANQLIAAAPDDPLGYVLLARVYWSEQLSAARALSIERYTMGDFFTDASRYRLPVDPESEKRFRAATQQAVAKARAWIAAHPSDPAGLFLAGFAYQNQASYEISIRGERWAAFKSGEKALNYFRDAIAADAAFADPRLGGGVAGYVVDTVPWAVRWLSFLLGYRGGRDRAKRELEQVAERAVLIGDDARSVLALFYSRDGEFERSFTKLDELHRKYPRNYLVHLEMAEAVLRQKKTADAIAIYRAVIEKAQSRRDGYERLETAVAMVRLGVALRIAGDFASSERTLRAALSSSTPPRTAIIGRLELAKTLDRAGRRNDAVTLYREVAAAEDIAGSRREAQSLVGRRYVGD